MKIEERVDHKNGYSDVEYDENGNPIYLGLPLFVTRASEPKPPTLWQRLQDFLVSKGLLKDPNIKLMAELAEFERQEGLTPWDKKPD